MTPLDLAKLIDEHQQYCVMTYDKPEFAAEMMQELTHLAMCISTGKIGKS